MPDNSASDKEIALLLYGNGADLGNFKFFADDLAADLVRGKKFDKASIVITQTLNRAAFFAAINAVPAGQKIKELHVFSHSIGGGLYVGYHDAAADSSRRTALAMFPSPYPGDPTGKANIRKISYEQVVNAETGGILTDHLILDPLKRTQASLKAKFATAATMKLWGCNSGVSGWIYKDPDMQGNVVSDQRAAARVYYWRALNTRNSPKPSIAQAFADFFGVEVYGGGSGSHMKSGTVRSGSRRPSTRILRIILLARKTGYD